MKNTNNEIVIKITKKHKIIVSVLMAIVISCGLIGVYVPRYVKQNRQSKQETTASADNEYGTSEDTNIIVASDSPIVKVIKVLSKSSNAYIGLKEYLNKDDTLNTNKLEITEENCIELEEYAEAIYREIEKEIKNDKIEENILYGNNTLLTQTNEFCNLLYSLYKGD